jgi:heme exporter protein A
MLETVDLECTRGERLLFARLALRAEPASCLHVAGENGAGKTSLLRILCGLLVPSDGEVRWKGRNIRELREEFWQELAYVGHLNGVKDDMTAVENVRFATALGGRRAAAGRAEAALRALGLAGFEGSQARFLSQGQRRRIALARLFLADSAPLWILDEPFTALDVRGVKVLTDLIGEHLERQGVVVLTTHQEVPLPGRVHRLELRAEAPEETA